MDQAQATRMQLQLRHNAEDLQSYLRDLESWETEIKKKEDSLLRHKPILKEKFPPVRSQASSSSSSNNKRKKKKRKPKITTEQPKQPARIRSYDYKSWDSFDVEKACEDVDYEVHSSSSLSEEEERGSDEEGEEERRRQQAIMEKEKGNALFKEGKHELAVECYTVAIELDPLSAILPANRAMALLKLERYGAAERDCSVSLALDGSYVKAYLRRGTARMKLGRMTDARKDFEEVLKLEPGNKMAKLEIDKLEKELKTGQKADVLPSDGKQGLHSCYVSAVNRPPHLRSKKPLRRIPIEDIGGEELSTGNVAETRETSISGAEDKLQTRTLINAVSSQKDTLSEEASTRGTADTEDTRSHSNLETASVAEHEETAKRTDSAMVDPENPREEVVVPGVPDTSIQFQADWKNLRKDRSVLSQYFKNLPISQYPALLQQSLETDIFPEIVSILHQDYVRCGRSCLEELSRLTKVKRFSVAIMFLSRKEKEGVLQLFKDLRDLVTSDSEQSQIKTLASEFGIKL